MNLIGRYNRKMNAIFMNSKNSKTPDPQRPIIKLTDKINLKGIIGYYIWNDIIKSYNKNKF